MSDVDEGARGERNDSSDAGWDFELGKFLEGEVDADWEGGTKRSEDSEDWDGCHESDVIEVENGDGRVEAHNETEKDAEVGENGETFVIFAAGAGGNWAEATAGGG